jgi:hypothetical protein
MPATPKVAPLRETIQRLAAYEPYVGMTRASVTGERGGGSANKLSEVVTTGNEARTHCA